MTRDELGVVDAYDVEVGLAVRHFRSTRRISQADFAAALGVNSQQVRRFECGADRMSAATLISAAERLKIAPLDLLPQTEPAPLRAVKPGCSGDSPPGAGRNGVSSARHRLALLALIQALQP